MNQSQYAGFNLDEALNILTNITNKLTNIKTNVLEVQVQNQNVIIQNLRQKKGGRLIERRKRRSNN